MYTYFDAFYLDFFKSILIHNICYLFWNKDSKGIEQGTIAESPIKNYGSYFITKKNKIFFGSSIILNINTEKWG